MWGTTDLGWQDDVVNKELRHLLADWCQSHSARFADSNVVSGVEQKRRRIA